MQQSVDEMLDTSNYETNNEQEKEEKLEKKFGMRMTEVVKKGANSMCNYSYCHLSRLLRYPRYASFHKKHCHTA